MLPIMTKSYIVSNKDNSTRQLKFDFIKRTVKWPNISSLVLWRSFWLFALCPEYLKKEKIQLSSEVGEEYI